MSFSTAFQLIQGVISLELVPDIDSQSKFEAISGFAELEKLLNFGEASHHSPGKSLTTKSFERISWTAAAAWLAKAEFNTRGSDVRICKNSCR